MLQILYSRDLVSISDLARMLQTNPRNIPEYKKELQYAGYCIDSVPGRYGGYRLVKQALFPSLKLDDAEQEALVHGFDLLSKRNDFLEKPLFTKAAAKILSSVAHPADFAPVFFINQHGYSMSAEDMQARYYALTECINKRLVFNMDFLSSDNVTRNRNLRPYKLFIYNGAWFVIGFCEYANDIRFFKLTRIEKFTVTNRKFQKPSKFIFNESDYMDENGFKVGNDWTDLSKTENNTWYRVKLKLHGRPAMYVKEYLYGRNQTVTSVDQNTTLLECDMQYRYNIIRTVLGFGPDCEVMEPDWLKDEILKSLQISLAKAQALYGEKEAATAEP